jgi:hypothetical protein
MVYIATCKPSDWEGIATLKPGTSHYQATCRPEEGVGIHSKKAVN